jgi:diacylglycerol kinase (ATP)
MTTDATYKRIHFIINPAAGQDEPILNTLNSVLHGTDIDWTVDITQENRSARSLAIQAAEQGDIDLVAAYGGDGTISAVISGLVNRQTPLAILPGGTGNIIAKDMQIPGRLAQAAALLTGGGELRTVDVGEIDGDRHFMLRANVGAAATVIERAPRELKDRFGVLAYFIAGIETMQALEAVTYHLTLDGETIEVEGWNCSVINIGSIGALDLKIADSIQPDDGYLDVMVLGEQLNNLLATLPTTLRDNKIPPEVLPHWRVKEAVIEADPPQKLVADGEFLPDGPLRVCVLPGALQVLVPHDAPRVGSLSDGE